MQPVQEEERRKRGVQKDLKKKKEYYLQEHRGRRRRFSASSVVEKASDGFLFPQARECPHRRCPDMLQSTLVYGCVQDLTPGSIRVLVVLLPPPPPPTTTTTHVPLCEARNALHHRQTTALAFVSLWPLQQVVVPQGMTPLPQRKESKTAKDTRAKIPKFQKVQEIEYEEEMSKDLKMEFQSWEGAAESSYKREETRRDFQSQREEEGV